ncbi:S8 family peptidase [Carboxydocella sp. ULO1]|uniref:S8 family peptidase n=1 Tax=Carboxydocella sp. ULO1 TaxID=1926599 RepID=UPI0009ADE852|nr:S8 family peptidase [Carboxydocella sp. ULO1]GAW28894.1 hypothetical protein ULO1_14640 [Carboxydocella sp. ULO1]
MKQRLLSLMLVFIMLLSQVMPAAAGTVPGKNMGQIQSTPGEYIVKLRNKQAGKKVKANLQKASITVLKEKGDRLLVKARPGQDTRKLQDMMAAADIEYVEPNYILQKADVQPAEPLQELQWGLPAVKAPESWNLIYPTAPEVTVAVVDTGVDYTHPDLKDRVDTEYDRDLVNNDDDAMDDEGHGTHVAGIIAAAINGRGISGVSGPANIRILPVKVLNAWGSGSVFDIAEGIRYAADRGAAVINMSLGGKVYSRTLAEAVAYAQNKGALIVAAAGNSDDNVEYFTPASLPGVLAVGAIDENKEKAYFSNWGRKLDLVAPGVEILSSIPEFVYDYYKDDKYFQEKFIKDQGASYLYASGTSMAAPHVAGAAALLKAVKPDLKQQEIAAILLANAEDLGAPGFDDKYGYGLLDIQKALNNLENKITRVQIHNPRPGQLIWGKTDVKVELNQPRSGQTLKLTLIGPDNTEISLPDQEVQEDKFVYLTELDIDKVLTNTGETIPLPDGDYLIKAELVEGQETVATEELSFQVKRELQNGIQVQVFDPEGKPADRAWVILMHKGYWDEQGWHDGWPLDIAYFGITDHFGQLTIPAADAVDGNKYDLYVLSDPYLPDSTPFLYRKTVSQPGKITFYGTGLQQVKVKLEDRQNQPVAAAEIMIDMIENDFNYYGFSLPLGKTDANGELMAYVDKGLYRFQALETDPSDHQIMMLQTDNISLNGMQDIKTVNFDLEKAGIVRLSDTTPDKLQVTAFLDGVGIGLPLTKDVEALVTARDYFPAFLNETTDETKMNWFYFTSLMQPLTLTAGQVQEIDLGGEWSTTLQVFEPDPYMQTQEVVGQVLTQTQAGQRLWEVYREKGETEPDGTVQMLLKGEKGKPKFVNLSAKGLQEEEESGFVWPEMKIYDQEGNEVVNAKAEAYWSNFFIATENLAEGKYTAIYTLNGGPLVKDQQAETGFQVAHEDGKDTLGEITVQVTDVDGQTPARNPFLLIFEVTPDQESSFPIYADYGDENGMVAIPGGLLAEDRQYYLLVQNTEAEERALAWFEFKKAETVDHVLKVDLSKTTKVQFRADLPEDFNGYASAIARLKDARGKVLWETWLTDINDQESVRLTPGSYDFALYVWDEQNQQTLAYLTAANQTVPADAGGQMEFSLANAVTISVENDDDSLIVLNQAGGLFGYLIDPGAARQFKVSPGQYRFQYLLNKQENEEHWFYVLGEDVARTVDGAATLEFDDEMHMEFELKDEFRRGDTLTGTVKIADSHGNRLTNIWAYSDYYEIYRQGQVLVKDKQGDYLFMDFHKQSGLNVIQKKNHFLIAPILNIYDQQGKQLVHKKDYLHYREISHWLSPVFQTGQTYRAELYLGVSPSQTLTQNREFTILPGNNADLARILINGQPLADFEPNKTEYTVTLPYGAELPTVEAFAQDELARVEIQKPAPGNSLALITVTAEDGTEKVYTIKFVWAENPFSIKVQFLYNGERADFLADGKSLDAEVEVRNCQAQGQQVMVIVALYNQHNQMENFVYVSKFIEAGAVEYLHAGFNLPSNVNGYKVKVFIWDGMNLAETKATPLSKEFLITAAERNGAR